MLTGFFMFMHRLPNGKLTMHEGLPRDLAIKRMEDHERWCQEHREELSVILNNCSTICSGVDDNGHDGNADCS